MVAVLGGLRELALVYGVQPKDAGPDLVPGRCSSQEAHDRDNLGLGGRRVQVSRAWSGKTLSEHRADRATVVREVLEEGGIAAPERGPDGPPTCSPRTGCPRFVWATSPRWSAGTTSPW